MIKKIITLSLLLLSTSCSSSSTNNNYKNTYFTVSFLNWDGTNLYDTSVKYGETAVYNGPTPTKPAQGFKYYEFSGWDKSLHNILRDTVTMALFKEKYNKDDPEYTSFSSLRVEPYSNGYDVTGASVEMSDIGEKLIFPDYYDGLPIVSLGRNRDANTINKFFSTDTSATSIKFPKYTTIIGYSLFNGYERKQKFASIELPEECREVRGTAFRCNKTVTYLSLNQKLETIGEYAFSELGHLLSLKLPKNLKSIGNNAFAYSFDDTSPISIYIPKSVTYIGDYAFFDTYMDKTGKTKPVNITLYCEAESKPDGWSEKWNWYALFKDWDRAPAFSTNWGVPFPY